MPRLAGFDTGFADIHGVRTEIAAKGDGRPFLFLHPGQGLHGAGPALERLSALGRVVVPSHPGFGASALPPAIATVDDLAYFYLDLIEQLGLGDPVIVGASFGGWLAAEVAVRCPHAVGRLVLVDALGIKVGSREARDIADMHAVGDAELAALLYADPARHAPDYAAMAEEEVVAMARDGESWAFYGWRPYMHNPKLRGRLHRIGAPTLVLWGEGDRVVSPDYGRAYAAAIAGAQFETIPAAGHLSFVEQPDAFAARVAAFVARPTH